MGVVYIGDRATGKTHLALELANPDGEYVKVSNLDYDNLRLLLLDENYQGKPTDAVAPYQYYLDMNGRLPSGNKQVLVNWVDTGGEVWRKSWQKDNTDRWIQFLDPIRNSEGLLLIIPPHRGMTFQAGVDVEQFPTQKQWCNRFERWVTFFHQQCPKVRHLAICMNKADLFCNLSTEGGKLAYKPHGSSLNWQQRHSYVLQKYFRPIYSQIEKLNQGIDGGSVRCFITSIYHRSLLELPWIYLGSFLAK
ncbi:hypothetical protein SR1949_13100 [Sphaerospermopsis reniformis]|uniref:Uncharacterized protein n=1 Tax=Sphaerospermopsis reniformis TaxID=531300 RepID=A0A479ZY07_9CYAN|nr:hypothetical protein [Sphaerospermopsis reniformis]GCL36208.1 hypothetical protein SR1949_13100 [Sphaerospermopsis reniformis]